jgi:3',5'-cyclic AMP phosphodiesterase CpdA
VRFALISDVHFGPVAYNAGRLSKLSHEAARLTRSFVDSMNDVERPALVINLGDVIEDQDPAADRRNYREFLSIVHALEAPILHVAGNHDTINLSDDDLRELWEHSGPLHYSRRIGDLSFLVLHTRQIKDTAVHLSLEQLEWVEAELQRLTPPVIVLMHHPASEMRLTGNHWFEHAPHICRVAERRALRRLLEQSGKVAAVFNGHVHWNHFDIAGGIAYITVQSLTENLDADAPGRPAAAWAVCDMDQHRLVVELRGEEAARYQVEL